MERLRRAIRRRQSFQSLLDSLLECRPEIYHDVKNRYQENTMPRTTLVYDPVAPCLAQSAPARRNLDSLEGKVVGFIDNAKPNFNHLVEDLSRVLIERHGVK